jgi:hypothetical protein
MSLREADRRNGQRNESTRKSQRILSFKAWCALNNFSEATGRRIIRAGKVRVIQLSERRIGIGEDDNADFQGGCARAPLRYQSDVIKESDVIRGISPPQTKRGAQPRHFWPLVKDHVFAQLHHHGPPSPDDPDWSNQAAVEKVAADFLSLKEWQASESTIRQHVEKFIEEWKRTKNTR